MSLSPEHYPDGSEDLDSQRVSCNACNRIKIHTESRTMLIVDSAGLSRLANLLVQAIQAATAFGPLRLCAMVFANGRSLAESCF